MKWICMAFFGLPYFSHATQCDPLQQATASILYEICSKDSAQCYFFDAFYRGNIRRRASLISTTVLPEGMYVPSKKGKNEHSLRRNTGIIMSGDIVEIKNKDGERKVQQAYGTLRYYDTSAVSRNATIEEHYLYRDIQGNIELLPSSRIERISRDLPTTLAQSQALSFLNAARVGSGYKLVMAGTDYIVDEVKGTIVDKTGQYIYLRAKGRMIKQPIARFIANEGGRLPSEALSVGRTITRGGGAFAKILLNSPLGSAMQLSLAPSQAACSNLTSVYIKNLCSGSQRNFREWFRNLDLYDREQVLKEPSSCEVIKNFLSQEHNQRLHASESKIENFRKNFSPSNVQCGSRQSAQFTMQRNTLGQGQVSDDVLYRYTVAKDCGNSKAYGCSSFRFNVEPVSAQGHIPVGPTSEFVITDSGANISGAGIDYSKGLDKKAKQTISIGENVDLHKWLLKEVGRTCYPLNETLLEEPTTTY